MGIPAAIRAGDTASWVQPAAIDLLGNPLTAAEWALTTFLRFNAASEAITVVGSARSDGGWDNSVAAATTAGMNAGTWYWQSQATSGATVITLGAGSLTVEPSLAYTGTATAFDGRSQAEQDLEAVQSAIRGIIAGKSKYYMIGTRQFTALDLPALMERESQLKAIVARERAAESLAAGLGNPRRMFVRFTS